MDIYNNENAGQVKAARSASYPGISLIDAYNFSNRVYEKFSTTEVTRKEIAVAINRHPSGIARDIAAASSFGFLEKGLTKGDSDFKYKVTPLFIDVLRPESEKQKRLSLIAAFGKPKLYADLIAKFDGQVIPETLPNTLIKHHGITVSASKECADVFFRSGIEAGVISEGSRVLNYKATLGATSKTQYAEIVDEAEQQASNLLPPTVSAKQEVPVIIHSESFLKDDVKTPIHLTRNKLAYLIYPRDISEKDIKLLEHAVSGILLKLELEKEGESTKD